MRRAVIGIFKSQDQAERALREIEESGFANNQISLVIKKGPEAGFQANAEYAGEITEETSVGILHDFDSFLVQADNVEVPGIGEVSAGGPLSGALIQGDKSLSEALTYYGISAERAAEIEKFITDGYVFTLIETNSTKANEAANLLNGHGAHKVEKWSKTISKPIKPWN